MPLGQQLIDSVCASNVKSILHVLALANTQQVNTTVGPRDLRTPLHLACAMGNLAIAQLLIWVSQSNQKSKLPYCQLGYEPYFIISHQSDAWNRGNVDVSKTLSGDYE